MEEEEKEVYQFSVKSLEQTSFKVLKDHLCPENAIRLWHFTKVWNIPIIFKLQCEAFHFICENFEEVSLCEEFQQLTVQELCDILAQDDLHVTQESSVYQSVLRWIKHMPEERQGDISTLLPKVRLGLMDKSYITDNVLNNVVVKTNPESHLLVFNILQVMSQPSLLCSETGINNTLFCRRLPHAVLLLTKVTLDTIEAFDYTTNSWTKVHTHPGPYFSLCGTVILGEYLYIGGSLSDTMWRFNLVTHTWQEMSKMHESRPNASVAVLNGIIYIMGGLRRYFASHRTAERFHPDINKWTFIASMNEKRRSASCTTLNNKIYICGGLNNRTLNSAEYYDPVSNQWTLITTMGTPRSAHGVVAYMGQIFAVGGADRTRFLSSAEAYDPVTDTWQNVTEMKRIHGLVSATVMNKRIFAVSCMDETNVECYDYTTNTWSVLFSGTDKCPFLVNCNVITRLPNMSEYCSPSEPYLAYRAKEVM